MFKRNFFRDILRDTNSKKYSMTKTTGLVTLIILILASLTVLWIMIVEKKIDHFFIGELIALLLTLLGFKNFRNKNKPLTPQETSNNGDKDHDDRNKFDELG